MKFLKEKRVKLIKTTKENRPHFSYVLMFWRENLVAPGHIRRKKIPLSRCAVRSQVITLEAI